MVSLKDRGQRPAIPLAAIPSRASPARRAGMRGDLNDPFARGLASAGVCPI